MSSTNESSAKQAVLDAFSAQLPQTHTGLVEERVAAGKALRQQCSRRSHAEWNPPADREDPVELLVENSRGRMEELIPIRYGCMAANPFAF
jgi:hypothetical protein